MRRFAVLLPVLLIVAMLVGCNPEKGARDSIAAAQGAIVTAQAQYHDTCTANPSLSPCVTINKAVNAQRLATDALRTYCGFVASDSSDKVCAPIKAAVPALQSAITNLDSIITDVKGLIH